MVLMVLAFRTSPVFRTLCIHFHALPFYIHFVWDSVHVTAHAWMEPGVCVDQQTTLQEESFSTRSRRNISHSSCCYLLCHCPCAKTLYVFEITKALLFKVGRARMIASFGSARVHIYSCSHTGSLSKRWFWKWSEPCILYHLLLA